MNDPYKTPKSDLYVEQSDLEYAGFWIRVGASIIDTILILLITSPLLYMLYGAAAFTSTELIKGTGDLLLSYVFPILATVLFWIYLSATPGKLLLNIKIVRQDDGGPLTTGQCIMRYIVYIVSALGLLIGFFWVVFDQRKQGWHDKIAKTVVIRTQ